MNHCMSSRTTPPAENPESGTIGVVVKCIQKKAKIWSSHALQNAYKKIFALLQKLMSEQTQDAILLNQLQQELQPKHPATPTKQEQQAPQVVV